MEVFLGVLCGGFIFTWVLVALCCCRYVFRNRSEKDNDSIVKVDEKPSERPKGTIFVVDETKEPAHEYLNKTVPKILLTPRNVISEKKFINKTSDEVDKKTKCDKSDKHIYDYATIAIPEYDYDYIEYFGPGYIEKMRDVS